MKHLFHPHEFFITGYSGSGKTTLIEKLTQQFAIDLPDFNIGFIKSDVHGFEMDKEGKDTFRIQSAGASSIAISSHSQSAILARHLGGVGNEKEPDILTLQSHFANADLCLIEGYKNKKKNTSPVVLVLDEDLKILEYLSSSTIAVVGTKALLQKCMKHIETKNSIKDTPLKNVPLLEREAISELKSLILDHLHPAPLHGLVLTGGKSTRMGEDKANLKYHQQNQLSHTLDLIGPWTENVHVSCRKEQVTHYQSVATAKKASLIFDRFPFSGPLTGILSAMKTHPKYAFLVVAIDLPLLANTTIEELIHNRAHTKQATCFLDPLSAMPEPLCAIYEPRFFSRLLSFSGMGLHCPRKALIHSNPQKIALKGKKDLSNINSPSERNAILASMHPLNR